MKNRPIAQLSLVEAASPARTGLSGTRTGRSSARCPSETLRICTIKSRNIAGYPAGNNDRQTRPPQAINRRLRGMRGSRSPAAQGIVSRSVLSLVVVRDQGIVDDANEHQQSQQADEDREHPAFGHAVASP
jgi:hypothetical protein